MMIECDDKLVVFCLKVSICFAKDIIFNYQN